MSDVLVRLPNGAVVTVDDLVRRTLGMSITAQCGGTVTGVIEHQCDTAGVSCRSITATNDHDRAGLRHSWWGRLIALTGAGGLTSWHEERSSAR